MRHIGTFTTDEYGGALITNMLSFMLGWETSKQVSMYSVDSKTVILQLVTEPESCVCDICKQNDGILKVKGHKICRDCVNRIVCLSEM